MTQTKYFGPQGLEFTHEEVNKMPAQTTRKEKKGENMRESSTGLAVNQWLPDEKHNLDSAPKAALERNSSRVQRKCSPGESFP
jgi:hypothetical protein